MRWGGVLIDLFGTVVQPFPMDRHERALGAAAEAVGLDPARCHRAWIADYENRILGRSGAIAEQLGLVAAAQGVALEPACLRRAAEGYAAFSTELMKPLPGALAVLEKLAELDVPVGLVSNAAPDFVTAFDRSSLRPLFRASVFSCSAGVAKPAVAIYLRAATKLGITPGQLLFVGDGSDDELVGAAEAGLTPVLVDVDAANTYDPVRETVRTWGGIRLRGLPELLHLID
jgi:putative hydrolase of the HAD superfamily